MYILGFSVLLTICVFIYWVLIPPIHRSLFLLICSLFFCMLISIPNTFYFLFNIVVVYIISIFINRWYKNKKLLIKLTLIWLIGNLCFLKCTNILFKTGFWMHLSPKIGFANIILPLGVSFIIFRLIHYIVEVYRGNITESSFVDFSLYILFFPTFLAGPIDRFPKFYPQTIAIKKAGIDVSEINYGLYRIIKGIIKKTFIADNIARLIIPVLQHPSSYSRTVILCSTYGLLIQVYMDFSGYTDVAIGIARLFGYKIMENFNKPFLLKNQVLFFRSWHISLYSWIRDYFFFPIFGYRASRIKLYLGGILTMVVFSLWHKISVVFLISGIVTGIGALNWQLFQEIRKRHPFIKALTTINYKYLDLFLWFLNFNSFSLILVLLFFGFNGTLPILKRIFVFYRS